MATTETDLTPSLSRDELIREFVRLDALYREARSQRAEVAAALASIACEHKGTQGTVHLESSQGQRVQVQFGTETQYDPAQLLEVSRMLGSERFDKLFKTKLEFISWRRELKMFLNTVASDERTETAKAIIRDATIEVDKMPYVSVEKSLTGS